MKYKYKWLLALLPAALLSSCAEDVFEPYSVEEPASLVELQYLKEYQVLKDYSSNLKLGAVVDAATYANKGAIYGLTKTNFHEVAASPSLTHQKIARDNGGVNTGSLVNLINTAKAAEQSVFGPALLSNIQQNTTYLGAKGILAPHPDPNGGTIPTELKWEELVLNNDCEGSDVSCFFSKENQGNPHASEIVAGAGKDGSAGIVLKATAKAADAWDNQFFITLTEPLPAGTKFKFSMDIKAATATGGIGSQEHGAIPGSYQHWAFVGSPEFPTDWKTYTNEGTVTSDGAQTIAFNLNDFADANTYYFDNISFVAEVEREMDPFYWEDIVANGDCEGSSVESFFWTIGQKGPSAAEITAGKGKDGSNCIVLKSTDKVAQAWDNQFFIRFTEPIPAHTKYKFSMDIKAEVQAGSSTQQHGEPGGYKMSYFVGSPEFSTDWQTYTKEDETSEEGVQTIAINLSEFASANTYYFDNIVFEVEKEHHFGGEPLTDEEKRDTVTYALKSYIEDIMKANEEGFIKSFDVLSNVISNDGSAILTVDDDENFFNWSEYLGEEDFARLAVKFAREYYAANGGNASDLKLFINEGGLENEAKLQGLVSWIGKWESDQTTKIDGISAEIKANYSENADDLKATEDKIEAMLKGLAATGKMVRISGININYINAIAEPVSVAKMTTDQAKKMGELYTFIVKKYKELIPDSQRYGIFVSNITDNGDTPNGLWNAKYSRKPQYGAFADGLK